MRIKASVGNAPKTATLTTSVYSLTLTAQTIEERKWLAGLLKAVNFAAPDIMFKAEVPQLVISEKAAEPETKQP